MGGGGEGGGTRGSREKGKEGRRGKEGEGEEVGVGGGRRLCLLEYAPVCYNSKCRFMCMTHVWKDLTKEKEQKQLYYLKK